MAELTDPIEEKFQEIDNDVVQEYLCDFISIIESAAAEYFVEVAKEW